MKALRSLSLVAVLAAPFTAVANAAIPLVDSACRITSEKDLGGVSVSSASGQSENRRLNIALGSVFVAKGAAIKLFSGANFTGKGQLLNPVGLTGAVVTDAGVYINAHDLFVSTDVGPVVGSFDCTFAGAEATITLPVDGSASTSLVFYNDLIFAPTGYRGNHAELKQVTLTNQDGLKQLSTHSRKYWGAGYDSTVDLDSGRITINQVGRDGSTVSTQVIERKADGSNALEYAGAVARVRAFVAAVAANSEARVSGDFAPVPNLELAAVVAVLDAQIESL